jgi:tRNA threonylcarbamoyladenosine biosynthesis protein TsaE
LKNFTCILHAHSMTVRLEFRYTLQSIDTAAKQFWEALNSCRIFAFNGEMGAGKTTFIHYLCDYLQVQDTVSSPTFALINEYHFPGKGREEVIYHLDWYRLKDTTEAINAGMEDCIDQALRGEAYCFIEWPGKAPELLRPPYCNVVIDTLSETERIMSVERIG